MNDRIDRALDGELPADDLSAAERAEVSAFEGRVDALRQRLTEHMPADLRARIVRRIRDQGLEPLPAPSSSLARRLAAGVWAPRELTLRLRPAYGLAAAAVVAALLLLPADRPGAAAGPEASVAQPAQRIYVQFRFDAEDAHDVALAGSFSDWQPSYPMQRTSDGVWTVLLPITPGVHDYVFVVDGQRWVPDPYAPGVDDGFGGVNSRLTLLAPGQSS
jgi:hypothetical protein